MSPPGSTSTGPRAPGARPASAAPPSTTSPPGRPSIWLVRVSPRTRSRSGGCRIAARAGTRAASARVARARRAAAEAAVALVFVRELGRGCDLRRGVRRRVGAGRRAAGGSARRSPPSRRGCGQIAALSAERDPRRHRRRRPGPGARGRLRGPRDRGDPSLQRVRSRGPRTPRRNGCRSPSSTRV